MGDLADQLCKNLTPVLKPLQKTGSTVDMFTDQFPPDPNEFEMRDWIYVREELRRLGKYNKKNELRMKLARAANAMNIAQESYGNLM